MILETLVHSREHMILDSLVSSREQRWFLKLWFTSENRDGS